MSLHRVGLKLNCVFPTPSLVSPKFLHVPLGVGGWTLGYEERTCWANCPCNYFPRFPTYVILYSPSVDEALDLHYINSQIVCMAVQWYITAACLSVCLRVVRAPVNISHALSNQHYLSCPGMNELCVWCLSHSNSSSWGRCINCITPCSFPKTTLFLSTRLLCNPYEKR